MNQIRILYSSLFYNIILKLSMKYGVSYTICNNFILFEYCLLCGWFYVFFMYFILICVRGIRSRVVVKSPFCEYLSKCSKKCFMHSQIFLNKRLRMTPVGFFINIKIKNWKLFFCFFNAYMKYTWGRDIYLVIFGEYYKFKCYFAEYYLACEMVIISSSYDHHFIISPPPISLTFVLLPLFTYS